MAVQVRSFDQSAINSMPNLAVNFSKWWDLREEEFSQSLSKNLNLKVDSPTQVHQEVKHLDLQLLDQDSSSTKSANQSHQEETAMRGTESQEQCISSDSVQDGNFRKHTDGPMELVFVVSNAEFGTSPPQVDVHGSMTHLPYAYADPFFNGLFGAYGPQAIIQPQRMGVVPARVPLPLDLAEDGPIYVNAKQYNGIIRRRQMRARLEAQNKLVKTRKAYLHESRHLHALNRIRGSGGRFLSTKKAQQARSTPTSSHSTTKMAQFCRNGIVSELEVHSIEPPKLETSIGSSSDVTCATNGSVILQQPYLRVLGLSSHAGVGKRGTEGLMCDGTHHRAPVVW